MKEIYTKPSAILPVPNKFCPGCNHSLISKLIAEVTDEMGETDRTIAIMPIGCGGMIGSYLNYDVISALHGRASAVASGVKRIRTDKLVFAYQGDGDLASIGMAETIHAANRGENITVIFVNNAIFGMTGGQMAPTTLVGQKATTAPGGRDPSVHGYPMKMCELIDSLEAPAYIARFAVNTPANVLQAKKGIRHAFEIQKAGKGYSFVEILSACPTCWGLSPQKAMEFVGGPMIENYPLGVVRDVEMG